MMRGQADRLWTIGGALGAVALLAIAWFLFIEPRNSESASLREQAQTTEDKLQPLAARLTELRKQNAELATYQAQVELDRKALPTTSGLPDFLRGLQTAGETAGAGVSGVSVGTSTKVTAAGREIAALPITLTATGQVANLNRFLDQLQQVQPRAVLIKGTDLQQDKEAGYTMSIELDVFVAPAG
jgi:Tfp pilus assembly protein PilO